MSPVICFYQDDRLIYSENYLLLSDTKNIFSFLSDIEIRYPEQMKIVQIDFDGLGANVFILDDYKLISAHDLKTNDEFNLEFFPTCSKNKFIEKICLIKKDISAGRYYQVNLTSSFTADFTDDGFAVFKYFFSQFKAPHSAYIPLKNSEILCYSPELFLEKWGPNIRTQPIKGTLSTDIKNLLSSPKETAELSMIVDLLRNDLNAICEAPVIVKKHREVMSLGYTQHTFSEIAGLTQKTLPDILKSTFPGGSISGCPKIESLKAINEIEPQPRGFYTGSIGWWQRSDFKLNIAIRSFKKQDHRLTYFAGCGIVYDSDPEAEWQELLTKASKLKINLPGEK